MRPNKDSQEEINSNRISNMRKSKDVAKTKKEQEWLEENKEAIEKQNERMKKRGLFGDEYRRF